ncbi:MAG: phosphotransacetylase family protein [Calditrichia bacterium]
MKNIFVAATRQNNGKTMTSLGLFHSFQQRFENVAYMKPVGQQYRIVDGEKIDKDAVLIQKTYNLSDNLSDMSPIAIPRGFTSNYVENGNQAELFEQITTAYSSLSKGKDFVLIEGTGHAGVGSVFDASNAQVARLLGAKVILVSTGGVGKPVDEILMNKALFDAKGVEVVGVIVNKVMPEKYDRIKNIVTKAFARHDLRVLGVIPMVNELNVPSVAELAEDLDAEPITEDPALLRNPIHKFVIGDMQPHNAVESLTDNSLLIVPGDRDGIIVTALCGNILESSSRSNVAAMVFTDGIKPHSRIMNLIKESRIPVMLVEGDSFSVATRINNSIFKLRADELNKIRQAQTLIEEYVEVDQICELI